MRLRLLHAASSLALLVPGILPLHADTLTDHFVFHYQDQTHGTQDVLFDLPATGTYPIEDPFDIHIPHVQGTVNGVATMLTEVLISSTQQGGGISPEYKGFGIVLYGPQLYDYFADDPNLYTFKLGTFGVYDNFSDGTGTVTITQNAASAVTPEPASLFLLCTGLLGTGARLRLRQR